MTEKTPKTSDQARSDEPRKATSAPAGAQSDASPAKDSSRAGGKSASATHTPGASAAGATKGNGKQGQGSSKRTGVTPGAALLVVLVIVVVALSVALWYQFQTTQQALADLRTDSQAATSQTQQALDNSTKALDGVAEQNKKLDALSKTLSSSKTELDGLSQAFQMITDRGSDLVLINDIDHLVTIAQQQLQLSGNVANAIISLETAQAQLARANRPSLASLQQTINGDLDRLRAASTIDIALLSGRLDELAGLVSQAPLLVPDDAAPGMGSSGEQTPENQSFSGGTRDPDTKDTPTAHGTEQPWWRDALDSTTQWAAHTVTTLRDDLGQFISVQRVDDATALLISPDQATRFRDNLRLRIMTAQLALMMGHDQVWETETASLLNAIEGRFDKSSGLTRKALKIARDVADTSIVTSLPTVTNSIKALEALRDPDHDSTEPSDANGDAQ